MSADAPERPNDLPGSAQPAWQAYHAMLESKSAHYSFLEHLEIKYREGGQITLAERARLDGLLKTHDARVSDFAAEIKALGAHDESARGRLLALLTATADPTGRTGGISH